MLLDAALLAFLAVAATLGALAGLLRPLFLFAGTALGWLAARHLSGPAARLLASVAPSSAARPVAAVVLFVVVAGTVAWLGRRLSRNWKGEGRPLDRAAGALLAGLASAAAAWVGLAVAEAVAPSLPDRWQAALQRSDLAGLVRENDLLGDWRRRAEAGLAALLRAADGPGAAERLARDPNLRALVDDPRCPGAPRRGAGRRACRRFTLPGGDPPAVGPRVPGPAGGGAGPTGPAYASLRGRYPTDEVTAETVVGRVTGGGSAWFGRSASEASVLFRNTSEHPLLPLAPDRRHVADRLAAAGVVVVEADVDRDGALGRLDDLEDVDGLGRPGQPVPAMGPPGGAHDPLIHQCLQDLGKEVLRHVHLPANLSEGDDRPVGDAGQVDHRPDGVVDLPRDSEHVLHRDSLAPHRTGVI